MSLEFAVSDFFPASADRIYNAWLDSEGHTRMTGSPAETSPELGAEFSAWEGYITGRNLELEPGKRIVQAWRTTEFQAAEADSLIEVTLEPSEAGTRVTIHHSRLPAHGTQYQQGWIDHYFTPMKEYFSR